MIYTSYFARMSALPKECVPISICAKPPSWYHGIEYKRLAPEYNTLMNYKRTGDTDRFIMEYCKSILSGLDAKGVEKRLYELSGGKDVVLLCFEKSCDFCHRHLVSVWLTENGINCEEIK